MNKKSVESLLIDFLKDNKKWMIGNFILILFNYPFEIVVLSYLSGQIFSRINNLKKNWNTMKKLLVYLLVAYIILELTVSLNDYYHGIMTPKLETHIRKNIIQRIINKIEINYDTLNLGEITQRLLKIPPSISEFYDRFNKYILPFIITFVIVCIYLFILNWKIGLIGFGTLLIYSIIYYYLSKNATDISKNREYEETKLYEDIEDTLGNTMSIFTSNQLQFENNRMDNKQKKFDKVFRDEMTKNASFKFKVSVMNIFLFIILNCSALYLYKKDILPPSKTISIITMTIFLIKHIRVLSRLVSDSMVYNGTIQESNRYFQELTTNIIKDGRTTKFINNGDIQFQNIFFKYKNSDTYSLKNINLKINKNENVAIVGTSGSGKSTILKMILGFYQPNLGTISIDNINIKNANRKYLRSNISYINQNTTLFNRPIIDNIIYGTKYNKNQAYKIIKNLKVLEIFKNKDLNKNAGRNGYNLSGGQRQIIQLLRCYLRKSKIILLDEPTSAVDKIHKDHVLEMIKILKNKSTLIIVTHDLSIVPLFNRVIKMEYGKIIYDK